MNIDTKEIEVSKKEANVALVEANELIVTNPAGCNISRFVLFYI